MQTQIVKLSKLRHGDAINSRIDGRSVEIAELAALIEAVGLIQPLACRPAGKLFEVMDGNRRLSALLLLQEQGRVNGNYDVPIYLREEDDAKAHELSFVANVARLPLSPVEQLQGFARLRSDGLSVEEIATRFSVESRTVKQRLALGSLAPAILAAFKDGRINLAVAQAFTLSPDHSRQLAVWEDYEKRGWMDSQAIRRALAADGVKANEPRALFVRDAYHAAGGPVLADLFSDYSVLTDVALVDRLVAEAVEAECAKVKADGWKWAALADDMPSDWRFWPRAETVERKPTREEKKRLAEIEARLAELDEGGESLMPADGFDTLGDEWEALEAEQAALAAPVVPAKAKKSAGVVLQFGWDGRLEPTFGLIKPEDVKAPKPVPAAAADAEGDGARDSFVASEPAAEPEEDDGLKPFSESMRYDLSRVFTSAVMADVAKQPNLAEALLLAGMVRSLSARPSPVNVTLRLTLKGQAHAMPLPGHDAVNAKLSDMVSRLPVADYPALVDHLCEWPAKDRRTLMAHLVAAALDCRSGNGINADARAVALAAGTNVAKVWRPGAADFFGDARVAKAHALAAIEAVLPGESAKHADKKKADLAHAAEHAVAKSDWLPADLILMPLPATTLPQDGDSPESASDGPVDLPALPAAA